MQFIHVMLKWVFNVITLLLCYITLQTFFSIIINVENSFRNKKNKFIILVYKEQIDKKWP